MGMKNGENGGRGGGFPDAPEVKGQSFKNIQRSTFNAQRRRGEEEEVKGHPPSLKLWRDKEVKGQSFKNIQRPTAGGPSAPIFLPRISRITRMGNTDL
jgi:hypothetical protein